MAILEQPGVTCVQCPVLVEGFLEVLLCPVFLTVDICLDHALPKRPGKANVGVNAVKVQIATISGRNANHPITSL